MGYPFSPHVLKRGRDRARKWDGCQRDSDFHVEKGLSQRREKLQNGQHSTLALKSIQSTFPAFSILSLCSHHLAFREGNFQSCLLLTLPLHPLFPLSQFNLRAPKTETAALQLAQVKAKVARRFLLSHSDPTIASPPIIFAAVAKWAPPKLQFVSAKNQTHPSHT